MARVALVLPSERGFVGLLSGRCDGNGNGFTFTDVVNAARLRYEHHYHRPQPAQMLMTREVHIEASGVPYTAIHTDCWKVTCAGPS